MSTPSPTPPPAVPVPQNGSQGVPWWIYNVIAGVVGLALIGLGIYDHDNQVLMDLGILMLGGAGGHSIGKVSPTPS